MPVPDSYAPTARERPIDEAIQARLDAIDAGSYRANNEAILTEFADWIDRERGVTDLADLDVIDCRRYAQYLRRQAKDDDVELSAASAAGPYFTIVRAFLSWCVDDERIDQNPARPKRVTDALPEQHGDHDRQFWDSDARDALLSYVDEQVRTLFDVSNHARVYAYRDRALVQLLARSGARAGELFAEPRDDAREGLSWADLDLDRGVATVFGKTREYQPVSIISEVCDDLERYHRVLAPPSDDWPVFPTRHAPSLVRALEDGLRECGWDDEEIAAAREDSTTLDLLREHEIPPPSLSTNGARSLLKRLCEGAGVDVDGEYLKPHGGRRALGSELYEQDAELAQETLRHQSIETTHESYREQEAVERRERLEDALE